MHRRSFITGLVSFVAAPAIVRVGSLMPVKGMLLLDDELYGVGPMMRAVVRTGLPMVSFRGFNEMPRRLTYQQFVEQGGFGGTTSI